MTELEEKVLTVIKDILYFGKDISLDTNLHKDLHADSLDLVELEISIETEFGISVEDKIDEESTVKDICILIGQEYD